MLGEGNLELFHPLQAISDFHTPNVKLTFEDHGKTSIHFDMVHVCRCLSTLSCYEWFFSWRSPVQFVHLSSTVREACGNKAPLWSDGICPFNNPDVIATHQSVKGLHNWVNECVWCVIWSFIPRAECGHSVWPQTEAKRERATEWEGPKALQQLWVHAVGLARRTVPWASTKRMKNQQRGNTSAELGPEHRAHCTTAPVSTGTGRRASCHGLNPGCWMTSSFSARRPAAAAMARYCRSTGVTSPPQHAHNPMQSEQRHWCSAQNMRPLKEHNHLNCEKTCVHWWHLATHK